MGEINRQVSVSDAEKTSMAKRFDSRVFLAAIAALALGTTLLYSVRTSGAQFAASTENSSNEFWAGQIDVQTNLPQAVLLTSDSLYPGLQIHECMDVAYVGTVTDVSTRMYADAVEGGLAEFLDITVELADSVIPCSDFELSRAESGSSVIYEGTLAEFASLHNNFGSGYDLGLSQPGDTVSLRLTAQVRDNNAAQGLAADFSFFLEGRP